MKGRPGCSPVRKKIEESWGQNSSGRCGEEPGAHKEKELLYTVSYLRRSNHTAGYLSNEQDTGLIIEYGQVLNHQTKITPVHLISRNGHFRECIGWSVLEIFPIRVIL
jgi:hypothetical protein